MFGLIGRTVVPLAVAALSSSFVSAPGSAAPAATGTPGGGTTSDAVAASGPVAGGQQCSAGAEQADGATTLTSIEGQEAQDLVDEALKDLRSGELQLHGAESALKISEASVNTVDTEGQAFRSVTIPVEGDYIEPSNVTVIYDDAGQVASYSESLMIKHASGDVEVTSYSDGQLSVERTIDKETLAAAEQQVSQSESPSADPAGIETAFQASSEVQGASVADVGVYDGGSAVSQAGIGSTVACIGSVLGVGGGTAYLISTLCAGACVTSATGFSAAVCAACIGGYATIGGASVTAVASCF